MRAPRMTDSSSAEPWRLYFYDVLNSTLRWKSALFRFLTSTSTTVKFFQAYRQPADPTKPKNRSKADRIIYFCRTIKKSTNGQTRHILLIWNMGSHEPASAPAPASPTPPITNQSTASVDRYESRPEQFQSLSISTKIRGHRALKVQFSMDDFGVANTIRCSPFTCLFQRSTVVSTYSQTPST